MTALPFRRSLRPDFGELAVSDRLAPEMAEWASLLERRARLSRMLEAPGSVEDAKRLVDLMAALLDRRSSQPAPSWPAVQFETLAQFPHFAIGAVCMRLAINGAKFLPSCDLFCLMVAREAASAKVELGRVEVLLKVFDRVRKEAFPDMIEDDQT